MNEATTCLTDAELAAGRSSCAPPTEERKLLTEIRAHFQEIVNDYGCEIQTGGKVDLNDPLFRDAQHWLMEIDEVMGGGR